ncbi:hypothetical protein ACFSTC_59875 [Nonomuraea ferruginea]
MSVDAASRTSRGPVPRAERALAPDLARGAMLLIIALANVAGVVFAGQPGLDPDPEGAEAGLTFLLFEFVHARGYPVFAVMFGYGVVQLARRQDASGATPRRVRSVLLRRNLWLVVFGFAHAALLYYGDFLGAYGVVGIVMTLVLLRRGDGFHRIVLVIWAVAAVQVLVMGATVVSGIVGGPGGSAPLPSDPDRLPHRSGLPGVHVGSPRRMAVAHADRPALHPDRLAGHVGRPPPRPRRA